MRCHTSCLPTTACLPSPVQAGQARPGVHVGGLCWRQCPGKAPAWLASCPLMCSHEQSLPKSRDVLPLALQAGKDGSSGVGPDVAARLAAMQAQLDRLEALLEAATAKPPHPAFSATS